METISGSVVIKGSVWALPVVVIPVVVCVAELVVDGTSLLYHHNSFELAGYFKDFKDTKNDIE